MPSGGPARRTTRSAVPRPSRRPVLTPRFRIVRGSISALALGGSRRGSSRRGSSLRGSLGGVFLAAVFLAAVFLAGAFSAGSSWLRSSLPGPSWLGPSWLGPSWLGPSSRAVVQAVPAPPPAEHRGVNSPPCVRPLGGDCADRGGGRADRRPDHLLAGADRVLRGPGDTADHACDGDVRDVLDGAERILRGHWRLLPERGQRTRGRVNHGNQAVRRPSGMGRARRGSCPRAPGRGG